MNKKVATLKKAIIKYLTFITALLSKDEKNLTQINPVLQQVGADFLHVDL